MGFIEREKDKINAILTGLPTDHPGRSAAEAAQQALAWASEPDGFGSPSATLRKFFNVGDATTLGTGVNVEQPSGVAG